MKKSLVLPGWMTGIKLYESNLGDFDINFGELSQNSLEADWVIGFSLGALVVLKDIEKIKGKIILINPPLPERNIFAWVFQWMKYIGGGLFLERQKFTLNPIKWIVEIIRCVRLLQTDYTEILKSFPKEKLVVVRSNGDHYFCDTIALNFLKQLDIKVVEIDGGHNWNILTEREMNKLTAGLQP